MMCLYPFVSIIVTTYGHEKYIKQALDSIIMQKVNFNYEVLVGEDCSPDGTRLILKNYEKMYRDRFVMIYRDTNLGSKENELDLIRRSKGKYLAFLEGDDYWINDQKLQLQIDFLESNPDFIATSHRIRMIDKNGGLITKKKYPECKGRIYSLKHYFNGILPGQTASIVMRNNCIKELLAIVGRISPSMPSDRVIIFVLASLGNIYCFEMIMSAYRYVTDCGTSYSATFKYDPLEQIEYYKTMMIFCKEFFNNSGAIKTIESLYLFYSVYEYIRSHKKVKWYHVRSAWKSIDNHIHALGNTLIKLIKLPIQKILEAYRSKNAE